MNNKNSKSKVYNIIIVFVKKLIKNRTIINPCRYATGWFRRARAPNLHIQCAGEVK